MPRFEYTPDYLPPLVPNEVFVFGSNLEGRHGKGAALLARQKYGAIYGQPEGLMGQSYAIPTKSLSGKYIDLDMIQRSVDRFTDIANSLPEKDFYVTKIGTGLAGWKPSQIAPLFKPNRMAKNIILPNEFWDYLF